MKLPMYEGRRISRSAVPLLVVVLSPHAAFADATIYGCANSRGRVRLIVTSPPTCRATETPVSWNQQGPPGPVGPGLVIKDANGAVLGAYVPVQPCSPTPGDEYAVHSSAGGIVAIPLRSGSYVDGVSVWYTGSNCTGQALMAMGGCAGGGMVRGGEVHNGLVYYGTGPETTQMIRSELDAPAGSCSCPMCTPVPPDGCCTNVSLTSSAAAEATEDLTGFVPPFHVEGP
jgi:hypothetical protein